MKSCRVSIDELNYDQSLRFGRVLMSSAMNLKEAEDEVISRIDGDDVMDCVDGCADDVASMLSELNDCDPYDDNTSISELRQSAKVAQFLLQKMKDYMAEEIAERCEEINRGKF